MNPPHLAGAHFRREQQRVAEASKVLMEQVLQLTPRDAVLITYDPGSDMELLDVIVAAVGASGASASTMGLGERDYPGDRIPDGLPSLADASSVWIELNEMYLEGTDAHFAAESSGLRRFYSMTGMRASDLPPLLEVDVGTLIELGQRLADLTTNCEEIHITCENGSDFRASCAGRTAAPDTTWMPLGQTHVSPVEATVVGQLVFDGSMFPPSPVRILEEPVTMEFADGRARVGSDTDESRLLARWMADVNSGIDRLCHVSYGYHSAVPRPTGRLVNDERVWGCLCVGFGPPMPYPVHTDLTLLRPTVEIDGEIVEREGVYVDTDVRQLARALGMPGYQ
jgi:leucyl aminopeptidase (aminopeptidase T)